MTDKPLSIEERISAVALEALREYDQIVRFVSHQRELGVERDLKHNRNIFVRAIHQSLRRYFGDLARPGLMPSCHICGWPMKGVCESCGATTGVAPAESQSRNPDFCWECDDINRCASAETCYAHHPGFPKAHATTPSAPLCLDCGRDKSAIEHRESGGHPFIATERRSGPGERRVKDLGCICARGDGRLGTNCQPQDKLSRRSGPPDRRRKAQPGQER